MKDNPLANREGTDGPFASIRRARDEIRNRMAQGLLREPVEVKIRGGGYCLREPLVFEPIDSWPVVYRPYDQEEVVLDGGVRHRMPH